MANLRGVYLEFQNIRVSLVDGIGEIVFDRPPLNVLNIEMMKEINQALKDFASESSLKLITIKGTGKAFSAGVDVTEHTQDKVKEMLEIFHSYLAHLELMYIQLVRREEFEILLK